MKIKLIILPLFFLSCGDILEDDIRNESIGLIAPLSGTIHSEGSVNFLWTSNSENEYYRFQMVSPDFEKAESAITDTLLNDNEIQFSLSPGTYEWRVRAENSAYMGKYSSAILQVDSSNSGGKKAFSKSNSR